MKSGSGRQYGSIRERCVLEVKWERGIWQSEITDAARCELGNAIFFFFFFLVFFSFTPIVTIESKVICYIAKCASRAVCVLGKSLCIFVNASDCAGRKGTRQRKGWGVNYKRECHRCRWRVSKSCTFQTVVFAPCVWNSHPSPNQTQWHIYIILVTFLFFLYTCFTVHVAVQPFQFEMVSVRQGHFEKISFVTGLYEECRSEEASDITRPPQMWSLWSDLE